MKQHFHRFIELDVLRGVAIIGMIVFHFFYILDFLNILQNVMYEGGFLILARMVQVLFITLVGVSLAIAYQKHKVLGALKRSFYINQWKRTAMVLLFAMIITIITKIFVQERYVIFGILHFIGVSIFLLSPFAGQKIFPLILGVVAYFLGGIIKSTPVSQKWLLIFGFDVGGVSSIDYFPLFPWISLVFLGIFLGNTLYQDYRLIFRIQLSHAIIPSIAWLGRNSLILYMLHIPLIFAFVFFLRLIHVFE